MGKPKSKIEDEPAFCFTSMIDIVFLLLIFFMLQPFKSLEMKLDNELPKDVGPSNQMDTRVTIRLVVRQDQQSPGKHGAQFFINTTPLGSNHRNIAPALIRECGGDKEVPVSIAPDQKVHFENVLMALDQCYVADMRKVAFEAPPPSQ